MAFALSRSAPSGFLFEGMHEGKSAKEVLDRDDLINRTDVSAADIVPGQLVSVRGSIRHRCETCVQAEEGHFEHLL
jgi:hypothetical protein